MTQISEPLAIVIASKNRPQAIVAALQSIVLQSYPPDDVVVIDQSDLPYDLSGFALVRHINDRSIAGSAAARNRGVNEITAPRVLFMDDDVVLERGTLAALQAAFDAHPEAIAFQCEDVETYNEGRLQTLLRTVFERGYFKRRVGRYADTTEVAWLAGYGMAVRRQLFAFERFDESLVGYSLGEDFDLSKRAARFGRLLVARGAELHHYRSPVNRAAAAALTRMRWANHRYFYRKHGAHKTFGGRMQLWWWQVGEAYRWLRAGLGLPSDRKALGPSCDPTGSPAIDRAGEPLRPTAASAGYEA